MISPTSHCGSIATGVGPSRVTDMHFHPNIEEFDMNLADFLHKALKHKLEQKGRDRSEAAKMFNALYPAVRKMQKIDHLRKGQPMETIQFTKEIAENIDGLVEVYLVENLR